MAGLAVVRMPTGKRLAKSGKIELWLSKVSMTGIALEIVVWGVEGESGMGVQVRFEYRFGTHKRLVLCWVTMLARLIETEIQLGCDDG